MGKGNHGNAIQAPGKAVTAERIASREATRDYSENRSLLELAHSSEGERAAWAEAELIRRNTGLLRNLAFRFRDRGVEMEDLLQIGTVGMLRAIRSFDVERGTSFSTYAVPLILGELRRHMRDEGPVKVGRQLKSLSVALARAKQKILTEEGREPRLGELAELCGVSPEEAAMALESATPLVSLSDRVMGDGEGEGTELEHLIPDEESSSETDRLCDRIALGQAVAQLPPLWQQIVALRFGRSLTQQKTADILGLSQVKVSREEKKLLEFLRSRLL